MTIEAIDFIVAVSKPMNLTAAEELLTTHPEMIYSVVKNVIDTYYTFSYEVGIMISDSDTKLAAALSRMPNVQYSTVGAGVHVRVIESKIRRVKEKTRSILHSLPFSWPRYG